MPRMNSMRPWLRHHSAHIVTIRPLVVAAIVSLALATTTVAPAAAQRPAGKIPRACVYYGVFLAGKVQVVTTSLGRPTDRVPTFKVQRVSSFPDLKVQEVRNFPNRCGKWQYVTAFPDFKVRFVTAFPDFKVSFVNAFPGVP